MPPRTPEFDSAVALVRAGRMPEAVSLLDALAARDDAHALNLLAELTWKGSLPHDPVAARALFARAAAQGLPVAAHRTTNLLASGIAGPRDWSGALVRLHDEATRDPARARAAALIDVMVLTGEGDPPEPPLASKISETPSVTLFKNLFTSAECDYLCDVATPGFRPSTVYAPGRALVRDPVRTSDGSTLNWLVEDPAVHALNRRLAAASATSAAQGEAGQVLRYGPGQQYRPHLDYLRATDNQRILTALVWLNEGYEGGETHFIETGLKIKGRKGDAIVFRNALPNGDPDLMSEHAGLPVTRGTKLLYSRWIRERRWVP
jgi:prolyl 4-hydroxylase